jgi:hypothetical protein
VTRKDETMKLKKAIEIINYYAYTILNDKADKLNDLSQAEIEELEEAREIVKSFLNEFN